MKIGIIGGGIVGSTAAFYLSRSHYQVDLYDDQIGCATTAAAGIICPWLSQRRNKIWYQLVNHGAHFYDQLLKDLNQLNIDTSFYRNTGVIAFKNTNEQLEKLYTIACDKKINAPKLNDLSILSPDDIKSLIPELAIDVNGLFAKGGAVIDGKKCTDSLLQACSLFHFRHIKKTIHSFNDLEDHYDVVLLTMGARSKLLLEQLHYKVDIYAQKGQLFGVTFKNKETIHYPVLIPQGEIDLLPFENGKWLIGATHENDMGFDLEVDRNQLNKMKLEATKLLPELLQSEIDEIRVGTRAYTSDFTPFFGYVPHTKNMLIASGLGSSGLTSGAYIGYLLHLLVQHKPLPLDETLYDPKRYITLQV